LAEAPSVEKKAQEVCHRRKSFLPLRQEPASDMKARENNGFADWNFIASAL
jgi:hypothetical protein